ncbi:DUF4136 domain-containing protein [Pseudomonadota bacterium]
MVKTGNLSLLPTESKRFSWHPTLLKVYVSDDADAEKLVKHMQNAITKLMESRGYQLVPITDSPSVLVGFGLALESEMSDKEILNRAGLMVGLSTVGVDRNQYEKGSVLVAIFLPEQVLPLWRVLAQGLTDLKRSDEEREQRIDQIMARILKSIPRA